MTDTRLIDLNKNLLSYLGSELVTPDITYASLPRAVSGGFDTRIFRFQLNGAPSEVSPPLILRVFGTSSQHRAIFESAVQNVVACSGYPAPRVFITCMDESVLGGSFMIMELMPGQIMTTLPVLTMSDMLAKAHLHLHSLETGAIKKALDMAGIRHDRYAVDGRLAWLVDRIDAPRCKWLQSGLKWIVENRPEDPDRLVVCHGDFHPINILITGTTISGVLDWSGFIVGDPAYDIGITKVLGTVAAPSLFPKVNWVLLITRYNECYQRGNPIDSKRIGYYEALKCVWALLEGAEGHSAWGHPEVMRKLSEHFKKITSVGLVLPKLSSS